MVSSPLARWLLVGVVLLAQAVAGQACAACDKPCCGRETGREVCRDASCGETDGSCPACAHCETCTDPAASGETPCRCMLESRDDAPGTPPAPTEAEGDTDAFLPWETVPAAGDSRRSAAGSPAGVSRPPSRPVRILLGVWRN